MQFAGCVSQYSSMVSVRCLEAAILLLDNLRSAAFDNCFPDNSFFDNGSVAVTYCSCTCMYLLQ